MHPHRAKAKASHAAKIRGYASGGAVKDGTDLYEPKVKMMKGTEGSMHEGKAFGGPAMKKPHMKGPKKGGVHVNIVNVPHAPRPAMPMPGPGAGMVPPPVRPIAPAPIAGPMGMPPPGVGPRPFKKGGRVKGAHEEATEQRSDEAQDKKMIARMVHEHEAHMHKGEKETHLKKHGGKVKAYATGGKVSVATKTAKPYGGPDSVSKADPLCKPDGKEFTAGAGTGEGRLEKEKAYGKEAGKPAKSSSTS